jgi:hypothetical protein
VLSDEHSVPPLVRRHVVSRRVVSRGAIIREPRVPDRARELSGGGPQAPPTRIYVSETKLRAPRSRKTS